MNYLGYELYNEECPETGTLCVCLDYYNHCSYIFQVESIEGVFIVAVKGSVFTFSREAYLATTSKLKFDMRNCFTPPKDRVKEYSKLKVV